MINSLEIPFCDDTQFLCSKLDDQIITKSLEISAHFSFNEILLNISPKSVRQS